VFDELVSDVLTVQQNIATSVATQLEGTLPAPEREALAVAPTKNVEAYRFCLEGANYLQSTDPQERAFALPNFEKAIELDPGLAEAYVGRGAVRVDAFFRGIGSRRDVLETARTDFEKALTLRPTLGRALRGLLSVAYETGQSEEILRIGERAAR